MNAPCHGFLNVLKPPGMTSSDVVGVVRRMLPRGTRVGHAGTLDPEAAGVLPIMVGKAARLFAYLAAKEKTYVAALCLGSTTDTQDAYGRLLTSSTQRPTREAIVRLLPAFTGRLWQRPPAYSAIKQDGKRLYALARAGEAVEAPLRQVDVFEITPGASLSPDELLLTVRCGGGTYIRALCHEIGQALGCGAHMGYLLRARTGIFSLEDAHTLEALARAEDLSALLLPIDAPIQHLPRADAPEALRRPCRNGNPLPCALCRCEAVDPPDAPIRVYVGGQFAGIARRRGDMLVFDAMLLADDPAPAHT